MTTTFYDHWREAPEGTWRWPNFSPAEIACRGTGKLLINEPALDRLQALRDRLGKPLIVRSAYRSPEHNRAVGGATVSLSGASTVPKHVGMHTDIRIYGTEGCIFFDSERARLELRRLDGEDEVVDIPPGAAAYDGRLPVHRFAALCAGKPVVNASNAEVGARVTEALDALYRSAGSGEVETV